MLHWIARGVVTADEGSGRAVADGLVILDPKVAVPSSHRGRGCHVQRRRVPC